VIAIIAVITTRHSEASRSATKRQALRLCNGAYCKLTVKKAEVIYASGQETSGVHYNCNRRWVGYRLCARHPWSGPHLAWLTVQPVCMNSTLWRMFVLCANTWLLL